MYGYGSTYVVVRLSDTKSILVINFGEKILSISGFEKITFFESTKSKIQKLKRNCVSSPLKLGTDYGVEWMELNFYDYRGFQAKISHSNIFWGSVIPELYLMSSSSHIRRVEISGEPRSFRQTFDVYLLFS